MLTMAAAKAAAPGPHGYKLADSGGLHLFVAPTGTKSWRLKCRKAGREQLLTLGRFPAMPLAEARSARDEAKARLRRVDLKGNTPPLESFEQLARAWHRHHRSRWSDTHATDVLASLTRDVFPAIGARQPSAIGPAELLAIIRSVEQRGCLASAKRLRQRLSAIFGFGVTLEICTGDPAALLGRAMLPQGLVRPQPALTRIEDCRALLAACEGVGGQHAAVLASRFLALTAVRLDAVRGARWAEFEDLDGPAPLWRVPQCHYLGFL